LGRGGVVIAIGTGVGGIATSFYPIFGHRHARLFFLCMDTRDQKTHATQNHQKEEERREPRTSNVGGHAVCSVGVARLPFFSLLCSGNKTASLPVYKPNTLLWFSRSSSNSNSLATTATVVVTVKFSKGDGATWTMHNAKTEDKG
jgi:hypothetical protein